LEHAEALAAGDDGCVVIDNSVRDVVTISILERDVVYQGRSHTYTLTHVPCILQLQSAFRLQGDIPLVVPEINGETKVKLVPTQL
jgi:aspartate-semialdehyde dehydrogenase